MASKASQRTVYVVTGIIVASMIAGFALADMSLAGTPNTSYQGSHTTNVANITGLTWVSTNVTVVPSSGNGSTFYSCGLHSPCNLATQGYTVCAGGFAGSTECNVSDFVEQVNLSVSHTKLLPSTPVGLTLYVTGTPAMGSKLVTVRGLTFYFGETGLPAASPPEFILLDFDIGNVTTGPGAVSTVSVLGTT